MGRPLPSISLGGTPSPLCRHFEARATLASQSSPAPPSQVQLQLHSAVHCQWTGVDPLLLGDRPPDHLRPGEEAEAQARGVMVVVGVVVVFFFVGVRRMRVMVFVDSMLLGGHLVRCKVPVK